MALLFHHVAAEFYRMVFSFCHVVKQFYHAAKPFHHVVLLPNRMVPEFFHVVPLPNHVVFRFFHVALWLSDAAFRPHHAAERRSGASWRSWVWITEPRQVDRLPPPPTVTTMLHRQRLILSLLADAGGEATHLEVTKWAFLTRTETASAGGSSFYQFVPYQYGPFSFGLFQEVAAMTRNGLIEETPGSRWRLTDAGRAEARRAESGPAAAGRSVVKRFAGKPSNELIDHVYGRYPWFTINSKIRREATRPSATPAVYTAGYEGLLIDGFLNGLLKHGIARLIDVRHNPIARRYGFHKSTLARLCSNLGIEYRHVPELGIPSDERQGLADGGTTERARLFEQYERTTLRTHTTVIVAVADMVKDEASVLVCMEAEPCECHRSHLAKPVAALTGLPIKHLEITA